MHGPQLRVHHLVVCTFVKHSSIVSATKPVNQRHYFPSPLRGFSRPSSRLTLVGYCSASLGQLSTLLQHACGITGFVAAYNFTRLPLRSFPSHGGLQAPEIYLSAQAVDGLSAGIYHYHVIDHVLESLNPGNHRQKLCTLAFNERHVESSAVVFLITGYYERLRWKYGERAYRFMCIDAGFLGENLYLVAEALELGACAISGFAQDGVEELLGIDGKEEMALMLLTIGVRQDIEGGNHSKGDATKAYHPG